jgi:replication initiation and membrane attachment protein DnaB
MTTKEYTLKANELKAKIESLRKILGKVNIPSISIDDNGNEMVYNFQNEYMYETSVNLKCVKSEMYDISRDAEKLAISLMEMRLDMEAAEEL